MGKIRISYTCTYKSDDESLSVCAARCSVVCVTMLRACITKLIEKLLAMSVLYVLSFSFMTIRTPFKHRRTVTFAISFVHFYRQFIALPFLLQFFNDTHASRTVHTYLITLAYVVNSIQS